MLGTTTVETSFSIKPNTYYMKVLCIDGYEGVLTEGEVYTVAQVTVSNNFLLEEVSVPEGYTSFNSNRFVPLITSDEDSLDKTFLEHKPTAVFYCIDL
jgi:hypothetical protein